MQSNRRSYTSLLALVTLTFGLFLLPVLQFLDANEYFKFRYGFTVGHLALILLFFAAIPLGVYYAISMLGERKHSQRPLQLLLVLSLLLFVAQLYSTTLYARPLWLRFGTPALLLLLGVPLIIVRHRDLLSGLALLSILMTLYAGYHVGRHWWRIPKVPGKPLVVPSPLPENASDLYVFFLDGCTLTSDYLDTEHYPQREHFPNLHRFLRSDAHWFYNAMSNGSSTAASLPSILTGKLYACRANNYLANEENLFSILRSRYEVRGYLHTKSHFCRGEDYELCYPFQGQRYLQAMRVLVESFVFLSCFRLTPISYEIGEFDESTYRREAYVEDFLGRVANASPEPKFYTIQLFDRGLEGLSEFDRFFGEVVEILERRGAYENSIVVLFSDHGYVLEGSKMTYGEHAPQLQRLFRVPFAIKPPGRNAGRIYDYRAQGIDIAPTILAQILPLEEYESRSFDGVNLLDIRPLREHYINRLESGVVYRFTDDDSPAALVAVPIDDIELDSRP